MTQANRAPAGAPPVRVGVTAWPARALMWSVRVYQIGREGRPSPCRFDPSCSTYALEAIATHGAVRGSWFAVRRIARCHPWGGTGYDPVPQSTPGMPR